MPTIDENIHEWGSRFDWTERGDEWSAPFGGSERLWSGVVYPRIMAFLPAGHILEIAPGHGRMTQFLLPACARLTAVDLNASCVAACRERFAGVEHLDLHVNDGRSLPMIGDRSVDLAFSFDSLVHVDLDVLGDYIRELERTLTADGVAFLHHSNAASFLGPVAGLTRAAPRAGERLARRLNRNWRARDVSAKLVRGLAADVGLVCIVQESVNWLAKLPTDCFTTLTRPGARWDRAPIVERNLGFMREARRLRTLAERHTGG